MRAACISELKLWFVAEDASGEVVRAVCIFELISWWFVTEDVSAAVVFAVCTRVNRSCLMFERIAN